MEKRIEETAYYKRLLLLAMPIVIQHLVAVGLNLVDNIMIGRLGALAMAAVGSANQIYSIYDMVLFGLFSGAAVPLAQYYGARDFKNIKRIVGMDIVVGLSLALLTFAAAQIFAPQIIGFFAKEPDVIRMGTQYIRIAAFTYPIAAVSFVISFNARTVQTVKIPMIIDICSILANTILNYILIYGNFGAPALGVRGAAIATLIARLIELVALIVYICVDKTHPFHGKLSDFRGFRMELFRRVMRTAMPVVISEGGWSLGVTLTFAAYGKINAEAPH